MMDKPEGEEKAALAVEISNLTEEVEAIESLDEEQDTDTFQDTRGLMATVPDLPSEDHLQEEDKDKQIHRLLEEQKKLRAELAAKRKRKSKRNPRKRQGKGQEQRSRTKATRLGTIRSRPFG